MIIFLSIAFILSPKYNVFTQTISQLGVTAQGALPFTLGLVIAGIFVIPYYWFFLKEIFPYIHIQKNIISSILGVIAGPALIGVGVFPENGQTFFIHFICAATVFICIGFSILIYSLILREYKQSPWCLAISSLGILVFFIGLLHLILSFTILGAIFQKINVLVFMIWHIVILIRFWKAKLE